MAQQKRILIAAIIAITCVVVAVPVVLRLTRASRPSDEQIIVNAALERWFSSDVQLPAKSKVVWVVRAGLPENVIPRVSGMKVVLVDVEDPQLANPDPNEHQVKLHSVTISGDEARLMFTARFAGYHKWANVQYHFSRVDEQWSLRGEGVDM